MLIHERTNERTNKRTPPRPDKSGDIKSIDRSMMQVRPLLTHPRHLLYVTPNVPRLHCACFRRQALREVITNLQAANHVSRYCLTVTPRTHDETFRLEVAHIKKKKRGNCLNTQQLLQKKLKPDVSILSYGVLLSFGLNCLIAAPLRSPSLCRSPRCRTCRRRRAGQGWTGTRGR